MPGSTKARRFVVDHGRFLADDFTAVSNLFQCCENLLLGDGLVRGHGDYGLLLLVVHFDGSDAGYLSDRLGDRRSAAFAGHAFDLKEGSVHVLRHD